MVGLFDSNLGLTTHSPYQNLKAADLPALPLKTLSEGAGILATIFIPTMLQKLTSGIKKLELEASSVRQVVDRLDEMYPGIKDRLVEDDEIRENLAVAIDGDVAIMGMLTKVGENSEVHFVPAIGGGF